MNSETSVRKYVRPAALFLAMSFAVGSTGCAELMKAAGAPVVTNTSFKILNHSPVRVCKVVAKDKDGQVVSDRAVQAMGIEPGEEGYANVDDRVGKVTLDIYGCDEFGKEILLDSAEAHTATPEMIRVK